MSEPRRLIEEEWQDFERNAVPAACPEGLRSLLRATFMAGAESVLGALKSLSQMDPAEASKGAQAIIDELFAMGDRLEQLAMAKKLAGPHRHHIHKRRGIYRG